MIYEFTNAQGVKRPVQVGRILTDRENALLADFISRSSARCDELCVNKVKFTWLSKGLYRELYVRGLTFEEEIYFLRNVYVNASRREMSDASGLVCRYEAPTKAPVTEAQANDNHPAAISYEQQRYNRLFAGKGA